MKKISIIKKINLIMVLIVVAVGLAFGYTIYARTVKMIDQDADQVAEYTFDLMDSTLSSLYQQVDNLKRNISLNQEVRYYYQKPRYINEAENARLFSEYMDILKAATSVLKVIKLYRLDGELIYRTGDSSVNFLEDALPGNIREKLDESNAVGQYWIRGQDEYQDVIRVFSYIYHLYSLELMGILEVQIPKRELFTSQSGQLNQNMEVFLLGNDQEYIWCLRDEPDFALYRDASRTGTGQEASLYTEKGRNLIYQRLSESGIGSFYLMKETNDLKQIYRDFSWYIFLVFAGIAAIVMTVAGWVIRHTLIPVVHLTELVNRVNPEAGISPGDQGKIDKIKAHQDEVGLLAASFEELIQKIGANITYIRESNRSKRKLELELLMAQIKPHFLYNTIEAICGIALVGKNEEVYQIAKSLGTFYRISLSKGENVLTVERELTHIKSYLEIEQIRSNYSFDYYIDMQKGTEELPILKMVLQPIVENAVEHGIRGMRSSGGLISVMVRLNENRELLIEVMDDGKGIDPGTLEQINRGTYRSSTQNGFGMNNVRERLRLFYTQGYGLTYESTPGFGTKATLLLKGAPEAYE